MQLLPGTTRVLVGECSELNRARDPVFSHSLFQQLNRD